MPVHGSAKGGFFEVAWPLSLGLIIRAMIRSG